MKQTALITGASSGIGKEFARIHAERGGDLIIIARSKDKLDALKAELENKHNIKVFVIAKDLSQPEAPEEIYNEVKKSGIEIDYLINNAGFGGLGKFHEREWEKDRAMINLNITALTALTRFFLPDFTKRNSGKILNVSSICQLYAWTSSGSLLCNKSICFFFQQCYCRRIKRYRDNSDSSSSEESTANRIRQHIRDG